MPETPMELTPEWLTAALQGEGRLPTGKVVDLEIDLLDPSKAVFGTLARLHVSYSDAEADLPATMIAKLPAADPAAFQRGSQGMYRRECRFFRDVAGRARIRVPDCYVVEFDEASSRFVLILEDLAKYQAGDGVGGLSPSNIRAVVIALARFHATWWESEELADWDWLPLLSDRGRREANFRAGWPVVVERLGHGNTDLFEAIGSEIAAKLIPIGEQLSAAPTTFARGDVRAENLFFEGPHDDPTPVFIDWQMMNRARGPVSIAGFLSELPDRDEIEKDLVGLYHAELLEAGVRDYSLEECIKDYQLGVCLRLTGVSGTLSTLDPDSVPGKAILELIARFQPAKMERYLGALDGL